MRPNDFNPKFEAAGCFMECESEILLLHRCKEERHKGLWEIPSGKLEEGEAPIEAVVREMREGTGYLDCPVFSPFLRDSGVVYVRYSEKDFVYYMFSLLLMERPEVRLSSLEHDDFQWISPAGALKMSNILMPDLDSCIRLVYRI